jgi:hypothetical protein
MSRLAYMDTLDFRYQVLQTVERYGILNQGRIYRLLSRNDEVLKRLKSFTTNAYREKFFTWMDKCKYPFRIRMVNPYDLLVPYGIREEMLSYLISNEFSIMGYHNTFGEEYRNLRSSFNFPYYVVEFGAIDMMLRDLANDSQGYEGPPDLNATKTAIKLITDSLTNADYGIPLAGIEHRDVAHTL